MAIDDRRQEAETLADLYRTSYRSTRIRTAEIGISAIRRQIEGYARASHAPSYGRVQLHIGTSRVFRIYRLSRIACIIVDFLRIVVGAREPDSYDAFLSWAP